jgi:hypothetical protein
MISAAKRYKIHIFDKVDHDAFIKRKNDLKQVKVLRLTASGSKFRHAN